MARFEHMKGVFGLLPTPYQEDYEIHIPDLKASAEFCCSSGQHGKRSQQAQPRAPQGRCRA